MSSEKIHNIIFNYKSINYVKINVYGIVTFIGSKNNKCTNLTIVDDTCEENEKLKCIVFDKNLPLNSQCELGDVVRLNRIKIQEFNGQPQGVCNEMFSTWVRFKKNDPTDIYKNNPSSNVTDEDFAIARNLIEWVNKNPKNQALYEAGLATETINNVNSVNENDIEAAAALMNMQNCDKIQAQKENMKISNFSSISRDIYLDLVCQIIAICDNKGVKFLLVWDGTKSNLLVHQEKDFSIETTISATSTSAANSDYQNKILYSKQLSDYIFSVYIFDEFVIQLEKLEPGDYVLLKNVRTTAAPQNSDADLLIKMPGIQNSNQSKYGRAIIKLCAYQTVLNNQFENQNEEIRKIIKKIHEKSQELNLKFMSENEFRSEIRVGFLNDTFADLIEKKTKTSDSKQLPSNIKKQTILSQVNKMMDDDTQMYFSSSEDENETETEKEQSNNNVVLGENINITNIEKMPEINIEPMIQDDENVEPKSQQTNKKKDPFEISQDIFKLKRLINLTYLCPFMIPEIIPVSDDFSKMYPFYTSINNLIEDTKNKAHTKCKVIAKLYNYSISSCPHIATVFVLCKKCNYINFTPFHLANNYQSGTLNNILRIDNQFDSSSQIPGTINKSLAFGTIDSIPQIQNLTDNEKNSTNFSLNWLESAWPLNFDPITQTQLTDDLTVSYNYTCPRCELTNRDDEDGQILEYIYRFWFMIRDADGVLNPCLLETNLAEDFLEGIKPIKFYTNQIKAHQVYKIIHKNFNKKFLFTLETYNLKTDENGEDMFTDENSRGKKLDILYKIVKMEELVK